MTSFKNTVQTTCLFFVLLSIQTYGQKDSTVLRNRKNEIGLNVGPIVLVMLGATPYSQPLGLTYKRLFNKWAFRTNFTFKPIDNTAFSSITENTKINDTTLVWRTTNRNTKSFIGRIGIEYRHKFKRGWYFVAGLDIQGQHSVYNRAITQATFKIDSVGNSGTAEQFYHTTLQDHKNILEEKTIVKQIGIGLTLGTIVPLSKRWLILAQFRADGFVGPSNTKTTDFLTGKSVNNTSTTFDFNTGAAVSELSLFYRF